MLLSDTPETPDSALERVDPAEDPTGPHFIESVQRMARGEILNLTVAHEKDTLRLFGKTGSYFHKQLAQEGAMRLAPAHVTIVNEIEVIGNGKRR